MPESEGQKHAAEARLAGPPEAAGHNTVANLNMSLSGPSDASLYTVTAPIDLVRVSVRVLVKGVFDERSEIHKTHEYL